MAVRPRIQRTFLAWLDEVRPRLRHEVRVLARTDQTLEFGINMGGPPLRGWLTKSGIKVCLWDLGECWHVVLDIEVQPQCMVDGYTCVERRTDGHRQTYATREALWRECLFERFGRWVNLNIEPVTDVTLISE
jgi:hypothetical protein